jgi:hypothetical protein
VLTYVLVGLVMALIIGNARTRRRPVELSFEPAVEEAAQLRLSGSTG